MRDFEKLRVWQEAFALARVVYRSTERLPDHERYGLQSQMRRAAVSVASNIAEGSGRGSDADFRRFVRLASGSASELLNQLMLAESLHGIDMTAARAHAREVRRMLWGLDGVLGRAIATGE